MKSDSPPEPGTQQHYRMRLVADPERFGDVRRSVRSCLQSWRREHLSDAVEWCVTEMLANVHRHVDAPECELALENRADEVQATVWDRSSTLPRVVRWADPFEERGRGMRLIEGIADRWGASPTCTGKRVWAVVRVAPPTPELVNSVASWAWLDRTTAGPVAFLLLAHPQGHPLLALADALGLAPGAVRMPDVGARVRLLRATRAAVHLDGAAHLLEAQVGERWSAFVGEGGPVAVVVGLGALARCASREEVEAYLVDGSAAGLLRFGTARLRADQRAPGVGAAEPRGRARRVGS